MMKSTKISSGIADYHYSRFLFQTMLSVFAFIALVGAINIIIDVEGRSLIWNIKHLNSNKYFSPERGGRVYKSIKLAHNNYDGVILGSSRAEVGLDPLQEQFSGQKIFNAGLSGTNMYEIQKVVDFVTKKQDIKFAIIGLDFLMFSSRRKTNGDFEESLFSENKFEQNISYLKYIFSTGTLLKSIKTIYFNMISTPVKSRTDGFRDKSTQINNVNHRELFTKVLKNNFLVNPDTYAAFNYSIDRLSMLESSIQKLLDKNIKVYMFISPIHARQLETLLAINLFDQYNTWKHDLVKISDKLNKIKANENKLELWDFSGYNIYTTENVPKQSEKIMSWYWESSHYKKELGDILVKKMFNYNTNSSEDNKFGIKLSTNNVKHHISVTNKNRTRYASSHPEEIVDVHLLTNQTHNKRKSLKP